MPRIADRERAPLDGSIGVPAVLVVPLDGSDFAARAVPVASRFAAAFSGEVLALTTPHALDAGAHETPAWLAALAAEPSEALVRAVVALTGDVVAAVNEQVAAHPGAAVCMATHARGAIASSALGNVARDVLRHVGVPVLLVGRHCETEAHRWGPMVVAHDGSPAADAVLEPARTWADACGVPLVFVHVYHPLDGEDGTRRGVALEAYRRLGPGAHFEVVPGSFPAGAIRDLAHELDASAIAMSTHGHTCGGDVAMGRVASWVTRESPCPVLAVRPDSLVSG